MSDAAGRQDGWLDVVGQAAASRRYATMPGGVAYTGIGTSPSYRYQTDGLAALIVDRMAEDALSAGIEVEEDSDGVILAEMDRLDAMIHLTDGLRWARLDGASAVLVLLEDGLDLRDQVVPERIVTVAGLRVVPGSSMSPGVARYGNPVLTNFGQPITYTITPQHGSAYEVHESRLLRFTGDPMPIVSGMQSSIPWQGRNALDPCMEDLRRYRSMLEYAEGILRRKQQAIHRMNGLGKLLVENRKDVVMQRLNIADAVRSILTSVAVDKEDEFTIADSSVGGIGEVIRDAKIALSASSGYPVAVLFGEEAKGIGATGEGDQSIYHGRVGRTQERSVRPAIETLARFLWAQRALRGKEPKEWRIVFRPLWSPSAKEVAEAEKVKAEGRKADIEALLLLESSQIVSPDEVRDIARERFPDYDIPNTPPPEPEPPPILANPGANPDGGSPIVKEPGDV